MMYYDGFAIAHAATRAHIEQYNPDYREALEVADVKVELRIEAVKETPHKLPDNTFAVCTDMQWWLGYHGYVAGCEGTALKAVDTITGLEIKNFYPRVSI
jgi:hypothetical protein